MAKHPKKKKKKISVVLLFDLKSWHVQFWGLVLSNESAVLVWNVDLCILRVDKEKKKKHPRDWFDRRPLVFRATSELGERPMLEEAARGSECTEEDRSHLRIFLPHKSEISFDNHGRKRHQAKHGLSVELIVCPGWEMLLLRFHIRPHRSRWLCRRLWCFDLSKFVNFCKIYMALNKTQI